MAGRLSRLLGGARRAVRPWADLAATAEALPLAERRALGEEARHLRGDLDRFLLAARRRPGGAIPARPPGTDWCWRPLPFQSPLPGGGLVAPASGTWLTPGSAVWHDLAESPLVVAQLPGQTGDDLPPFLLRMESFAPPDLGYVALSFDLPAEALDGLDTGHILQVVTVLQTEAPPNAYLRLNIEHGPDTERELRHLDCPGAGAPRRIETGFDLGFVPMNPRRLAKIWVDVILERPGANALRLHDLVISRHRRADV